jgi:urease accessory protein
MFDATPLPDRVDDLSPFDWPEVRARNPSDKDLQRAEGFGHIVLSGSDRGTRIMDVFQRSPIRIILPVTAHGALEEAVLVNTAG